eukprot:2215674-Lingulodinium_polyedra.AAC.1
MSGGTVLAQNARHPCATTPPGRCQTRGALQLAGTWRRRGGKLLALSPNVAQCQQRRTNATNGRARA